MFRVCREQFKGYDAESFSFNTKADPSLFSYQFDLFRRFVEMGLDVYAYITLTTPNISNVKYDIKVFLDRLQSIHEHLPLRTVPLKIYPFTPVRSRMKSSSMKSEMHEVLENQQIAVEIWQSELQDRYSASMRAMAITEISLHS